MNNNTKAHELAKEQREISVSEFFEKNRHLLGFDNPTRALLTTVKELIDNSLDATDEMRVLAEIEIKISQISETRFRISVEDNGPGIVKQQIPNIFAKLLYGSKFFKLKMQRGQQGIGVSASVLYGQLTTGQPAKITSKIDPKNKAHYYELHLNIAKNEPEILKEEETDWKDKNHGTKVELELEGNYLQGSRYIIAYLKQTAMVNPHLKMIYTDPENKKTIFPRATDELPKEPKQIKPHPLGIELGILIRMLSSTKARTLQSFLTTEFCRVGAGTAKKICELANIPANSRPKRIARQEADNLIKAIKSVRLIAPPTDCLSPIGSALLEKGLKKEVEAEFYTTTTRPTSVYRGFPFAVEAGIAYGGKLNPEKSARVLRFANKVPLLYQQGACAITKSIASTNWKAYGLQQSGRNAPVGPILILVHIASVWVPFTSESKEAIAHYPEIIKEIKLALQEVGRELSSYIRRTVHAKEQRERANLFEKYIPEVALSLSKLTKEKKEQITLSLNKILKKSLKSLIQQEGQEDVKKEE